MKSTNRQRIAHVAILGILIFAVFQVAGLSAAAEPTTAASAGFDPLAELGRYDVVWDSPSTDASGSMPIGNGEVGLNVWVEADGDLVFYISRTDAWSECNRLLKLGRVRVKLSPNPFRQGHPVPAGVKTSRRTDRHHGRGRDAAGLRGCGCAGHLHFW